ncbi:MAG: hypothetical protein AB1346_11735 [Thermodesulfobacteriota bacterium]
MTRKILIMMLALVFAASTPAVLLAGGFEKFDDKKFVDDKKFEKFEKDDFKFDKFDRKFFFDDDPFEDFFFKKAFFHGFFDD